MSTVHNRVTYIPHIIAQELKTLMTRLKPGSLNLQKCDVIHNSRYLISSISSINNASWHHLGGRQQSASNCSHSCVGTIVSEIFVWKCQWTICTGNLFSLQSARKYIRCCHVMHSIMKRSISRVIFCLLSSLKNIKLRVSCKTSSA